MQSVCVRLHWLFQQPNHIGILAVPGSLHPSAQGIPIV